MADVPHPSPHDALFKLAFSQPALAAALLRSVLPRSLASEVRWDGLTLRGGQLIDPELAALESDLLFSATVGSEEVLFYVLLEHQSTPDPSMAFRIWRYVTRIWERHVRDDATSHQLPRVVPVVVYAGKRPWRAPRDIAQMLALPAPAHRRGLPIPRLAYVLDDITRLRASELRARGLPAFAVVTLWALRTASDRSFAGTVRLFADLFDEVVSAENGAEAFGTLLGYSRASRPLPELAP